MFVYIFCINCDVLVMQIVGVIGNFFYQMFQYGMQMVCVDVFGGFVNLSGGFGNMFNIGIGEFDIDVFSCYQCFILYGDGCVWFG